jgi:hypothetical protein
MMLIDMFPSAQSKSHIATVNPYAELVRRFVTASTSRRFPLGPTEVTFWYSHVSRTKTGHATAPPALT